MYCLRHTFPSRSSWTFAEKSMNFFDMCTRLGRPVFCDFSESHGAGESLRRCFRSDSPGPKSPNFFKKSQKLTVGRVTGTRRSLLQRHAGHSSNGWCGSRASLPCMQRHFQRLSHSAACMYASHVKMNAP